MDVWNARKRAFSADHARCQWNRRYLHLLSIPGVTPYIHRAFLSHPFSFSSTASRGHPAAAALLRPWWFPRRIRPPPAEPPQSWVDVFQGSKMCDTTQSHPCSFPLGSPWRMPISTALAQDDFPNLPSVGSGLLRAGVSLSFRKNQTHVSR